MNYESIIEKSQDIVLDLELKDFTVEDSLSIDDLVFKKQTIKIDSENFYILFSYLNEYIRKKLMKSFKSNCVVKDIENYVDGYGQLEYYSSRNLIFMSDNCINYIKKYSPKSIIMNIYGDFNDIKIDFLKQYAKEYSIETPKLDYLKDIRKKNIKYSVFKEDKQYFTKKIDERNVYLLYLNLPYEYYKDIEMLDFAAYYDNERNEFYFSGTPYKQHMELLNNIAENGIRDPLFLKINNGTIVSTKDCHGRLMVAKMLKLPSIPVCLYLCAEQTDITENTVKKYKNIDYINQLCSPYFIFNKQL